MKRHVIYGILGLEDAFTVATGQDEVSIRLNLLLPDKKLNFGLGNALDDLKKLSIFPTETGADLLVFAAHVQAADVLIPRDTESQDSWSREIRLIIPVADCNKWAVAKPTLVKMLNFLTGDLWTINFRPRPTGFSQVVPTGTPQLTGVPYSCLSLLSGGLDSLIGGIDLLQKDNYPLFVSHVSEGAVSDAQRKCFDLLKNHYSQNQLERLRVWLSFPKLQADGKENEKTTRGRSFLFFTLGVFAGTGFNKPFTLYVPENGLIALNIPLDQLRLGSHSTRTTHPFYIARWNELLKILQIDGHITNPYWNKTKGEMVNACLNQFLLKQILPYSMSCSSPSKGRYRGISKQHCGYCVPCIIRRAAIIKAFGTHGDPTAYTISDLKAQALSTLKADGQQIRSFQFAIQRLRKDTSKAKVLIHSSGSLADESLSRQQELADVYLRGMNEVANILDGVQTKPE
jgi:hypothetical protein